MDVTAIAIKADTSDLNDATKDLKQFENAAGDAAKAADKVGDETKGASGGVNALGKATETSAKAMQAAYAAGEVLGLTIVGVAGAATAAAAAWAAWQAVQIAAAFAIKDTADELGKLSQKTGISVESLSELRYAAGMADLSQAELASSIRLLTNNMQEAQNKTSSAASTFASMGISVRDTNGVLKNADQMLAEIADKFASYEDGAQKAALAQDIFGRGGERMIPLLNQGADGLARNAEEARALGIVYSTETAVAAEQFNDNLKKVGFALEGVTIALGGPMLQALAEFTNNMWAAKAATGGFTNALVTMWATKPSDGESWTTSVKSLRSEIQGLEADIARHKGFGPANASSVKSLETALKYKQDQYKYAVGRQAGELAGTNSASYSNEGRGAAQRSAAPDPTVERQIRALEKQAGALGKTKAQLADEYIKENKLTAEQADRYRAAAKSMDDYAASKKKGKGGGGGTDKDAAFLDKMREEMKGVEEGLSASSIRELARVEELHAAKKISLEELEVMKAHIYSTDSVRAKATKAALDAEIKMVEERIRQEERLEKARAKAEEVAGKREVANATLVQNEQDLLTYMYDTNEQQHRRVTLLKIEEETQKAILEIRKEYAKVGASGSAEESSAIARVRADAEMTKEAWTTAYDEIARVKKTSTHGVMNAISKYSEEVNDASALMESAVTKSFKGMEDALVAFTMTGKLDFKGLADSIISDLMRIAVQQAIMKPLVGMASGGGAGFASMLGGMFGGGGAAAAGGGVAATAAMYGTAAGSQQTAMLAAQMVGMWAKGGVFPSGISEHSNSIVSQPTLFKFAQGAGLMGEAGPEAIVPLKRDRSGRLGVSGGGGTTINVNVKTTTGNPAEIKRSATQGARTALGFMSGAQRYG